LRRTIQVTIFIQRNTINPLPITTNHQSIEQFADQHAAENQAFAHWLTQQDNDLVDAQVHLLNQQIEPQIDCTQCGRCCKNLMINVSETEAEQLANHLAMDTPSFKNKYIETGESGMMIVNSIPCHFLKGTVCTVYQHRFDGCRTFPGLHLPNFQQRLFAMQMHYTMCPIIFNVWEGLKITMNFPQEEQA
jgi:uncharacterized protein